MELDKRIKEGKRPLTFFDTEQAKEFIGKECYFSNAYCTFEDLHRIPKSELQYISNDKDASDPYKTACYFYPFCLPCEWVEEEKKEPEKKYREYKNLDEFFDVTGLEIGDLIHLKFPGGNDAELLIVGGCNNSLFIGIHKYTFAQLFAMVEISISGDWQPFGVIEDE